MEMTLKILRTTKSCPVDQGKPQAAGKTIKELDATPRETIEEYSGDKHHGEVDVGQKIIEVPWKVEEEADNNCEVEETLGIIEEISDAPVPCPMVSLVSVEKETEKMVDGGTLEIKAERVDEELNNGNSADVKNVESEIVDRAESDDRSRESKILDSYELIIYVNLLIF